MASNNPVVDRIRIIPRPSDFLDRNVGASGELFYNRESSSLRVYNGKDVSGYEIARADLDNVADSVLEQRINDLGIIAQPEQPDGGASVDVSDNAPSEPSAGNLWLNTVNGRLYIYINDGDSSQWVQPAAPTFSGNYNDLTNKPALATVATSGSYNDLSDRPTFGDGGFDGSYNSLSDLPTIPTDVSDLTDNTNLLVTPFSGDYNDLDNIPTSFNDIALTGTTSIVGAAFSGAVTFADTITLQTTTEKVVPITGATGVVDHNTSNGSIFYHTSLAADFTANFTNLETTNNRTVSIALLLVQGGTPFIPTAVQIDGTSAVINWQGATVPSGTADQTDLVSFTLIRTSSTWSVIGNLTTYG